MSSIGCARSRSCQLLKSAVSWGSSSVVPLAAVGTTLILLLLARGVGLTMVSPWSGE